MSQNLKVYRDNVNKQNLKHDFKFTGFIDFPLGYFQLRFDIDAYLLHSLTLFPILFMRLIALNIYVIILTGSKGWMKVTIGQDYSFNAL